MSGGPGLTGYALQVLRPGADPAGLQSWRTAYVWLYERWGRATLDQAVREYGLVAQAAAQGGRLVAWGRADVPAGAMEVAR
jgi:hypothetical protein